jgi:hypothetical protein
MTEEPQFRNQIILMIIEYLKHNTAEKDLSSQREVSEIQKEL